MYDEIIQLYCFKGRRFCLVNALPTISNVWKKVYVAARTSSSRLSASHNALPDHQRETKMANVLEENEPFVIFWGRLEPRKFPRRIFELNLASERAGSRWTLIFLIFCSTSRRLKWRWPNEVLLSSCFPPVGGVGPTVSDLSGALHVDYFFYNKTSFDLFYI